MQSMHLCVYLTDTRIVFCINMFHHDGFQQHRTARSLRKPRGSYTFVAQDIHVRSYTTLIHTNRPTNISYSYQWSKIRRFTLYEAGEYIHD